MNKIELVKTHDRKENYFFLPITKHIDLVFLVKTKEICLNVFDNNDQFDYQLVGDNKITDFCLDNNYLKDYTEFKKYVENYKAG